MWLFWLILLLTNSATQPYAKIQSNNARIEILTPVAERVWISILEMLFWNYLTKIVSLPPKEAQLNSDTVKDVTEVGVNGEKGVRECKAFWKSPTLTSFMLFFGYYWTLESLAFCCIKHYTYSQPSHPNTVSKQKSPF